MNLNQPEINWTREVDDDCYLYTATATLGSETAIATAYTQSTAVERAISKLNRKMLQPNLTPKSPNWENSIESFLSRN